MKKKKIPRDDPPEMDMLAFASVMTILLAFFIMLSSFAGKPKDELAEKAIDSFKGALENFGLSRVIFGKSDTIMNLTIALKNAGVDFKDDRSEITGRTYANLIDKQIEIEYTREGQQLIFPTEISFVNDGSTQLTSSSKFYLNNLAKMVKDRDCNIIVRSFTDIDFMPTDEYPTSWQFSAERAVAVTKYINKIGNIDYKRLVPLGYGKYKPLLGEESSPGDTANNRIEIIISNRPK